MLLWTMCISLEILVITYLFPTLKYDILITRPAKKMDMKKKDLCTAAGISHASMAKLGKNENVTTDVLVKICTALQCDIGDIMELTKEII